MANTFIKGVESIRNSDKPISCAWNLAYDHLLLEQKVLKLIDIISTHENLFINYNPYHNHYHMAEVIWSTAFLAKEENFFNRSFDSLVILLLAATFHDADHKGKSNRVPFEQEKVSVFFFMEWWRNNSLFVENILSISHDDIERSICYLILNTDLQDGIQLVYHNYNHNRDDLCNGVELNKMAQILIEADMLMNALPFYGHEKISLIIKEGGRTLPENSIWEYYLNFISVASKEIFISDASKKIKLETLLKKAHTLIKASLEDGSSSFLNDEMKQKIKGF